MKKKSSKFYIESGFGFSDRFGFYIDTVEEALRIVNERTAIGEFVAVWYGDKPITHTELYELVHAH